MRGSWVKATQGLPRPSLQLLYKSKSIFKKNYEEVTWSRKLRAVRAQADGASVYSVPYKSMSGRGKAIPPPHQDHYNNRCLADPVPSEVASWERGRTQAVGFPGNQPPSIGAGQKSSH